MNIKPREFWIVETWTPITAIRETFDAPPPIELTISMNNHVFHVIEKSAYLALEQKLAVAVEALEKYTRASCHSCAFEHGVIRDDQFFNTTPDFDRNTAKEALALINADTKKESEE